MARACGDVDAVAHLGGHSRENSWAETLSVTSRRHPHRARRRPPNRRPPGEAAELGYARRDDAEVVFAAGVAANSSHELLGGPCTSAPLGEPN